LILNQRSALLITHLRMGGLKKPKILCLAELSPNKLLKLINSKEARRYLLIFIKKLSITDLIEILLLGMKVPKVLKYKMINLLFQRINKIGIPNELILKMMFNFMLLFLTENTQRVQGLINRTWKLI